MAQVLADIKGSGPPTENTPGAVGQIYVDTETALRWECIESHHETRYKGVRVFYNWECRGLDPDFLATDADIEKAGSASVKLNILETICENVTLSDDTPSYTFPTEITISNDGLYLLDYRYYSGETRDAANDICGLGANIEGMVAWGTGNPENFVLLTSTEVTDTWRGSGTRSVFSIYKVERVIVDPVQYSTMSLEGYDSIASGANAHAEGRSTIAIGMHSHAEGTSTMAGGDHSHAEGFNTIAIGDRQHVQGSYNIPNKTYAHIVGNGPDESTRSNAYTLDWSGNAWFAGEVYVGGSDQSDGEKLVTTTELSEGLSTKASSTHTHAQSDVTGLMDALAELNKRPVAQLVTLSVSEWDADTKTQTVTIFGVLADEGAQLVTSMPLTTSARAYINAGVALTGREENMVTFTAETIPTEDIKLYVVRQEIELSDGLAFSSPELFSIAASKPGWDGTMEYSTDATRWMTWSGESISAVENNGEYSLYLRGTGNTIVTGKAFLGTNDSVWSFTGSNISCEGNIETLLDYVTVAAGGHPTMATDCYSDMFDGCTSLTAAPALPATMLAERCYYGMFYSCTSLTTATALPATMLAEYCYTSMFKLCASLKLSSTQTEEYTVAYRIPANGTGTTANVAMNEMFSSTGGTFTGTPVINTTYYLHKDNSIVQ